MLHDMDVPERTALEAFVDFAGRDLWRARLEGIQRLRAGGPRAGKALLQRYALCIAIERLRRGMRTPTQAELRIGRLAGAAVDLAETLTARGRDRLRDAVQSGLTGDRTLISVFHLLRTAGLQRMRGFEVAFTGLEEHTPFDLLLRRDRAEAELACDVISAEEGRSLHRGAWSRLADRIDPDLQTWLAAHPGRYLLKITLPEGLQGGLQDETSDGDLLSQLHERIRRLLQTESRADQDAAVVLRLDPLLLAGAQADELGLLSSLRGAFGPEAHLSAVSAGGGLFVVAARAGRENEVAQAVRRRLGEIAPLRLSGKRPGILALFVEDTDRLEWRSLREQLELEGEARQFLTRPEARPVVAVTLASRIELLGMDDAAPEGELRFRNPAHPAAKLAALSPAVLSSV